MTTKTRQEQDQGSDVRVHVREHYGKLAAERIPIVQESCCGSSAGAGCCGSDGELSGEALDHVSKLYESPDVLELPPDVTEMSLGCGDPVTLATLNPGETVLDLGSGGGIDVFLAGKRVGETGHVIGVDMTAEMIEKARTNQAKVGATNVEFRLGEIEHLPVADDSVDVIISNCVVNLSPDKPQVFRETFRVLKSGGRLAVSDIVTDGPLPDEIKSNLSAWAGCVAGALDVKDYIAAIEAAGFVDVQVKPVYFDKAMVDQAVADLDLEGKVDTGDEHLYKSTFSANVTAHKP